MNNQAMGKRLIEREDLELFLEAYHLATGEMFPDMCDSEAPDFIGSDEEGRTVGIEITTLRFGPRERHLRSIFPTERHDDAWWRLLELMHQKDRTLTSGRWAACERKILVIMMVDASIADVTAPCTETSTPERGGFEAVWLADRTQVEAFGALDLFALVHPTLAGHFGTGNQGQKPYG